MTVVGRFAPTPSGRMHMGNLFSALLAWLSVRSQKGELVLRMEDLDTPPTPTGCGGIWSGWGCTGTGKLRPRAEERRPIWRPFGSWRPWGFCTPATAPAAASTASTPPT